MFFRKFTFFLCLSLVLLACLAPGANAEKKKKKLSFWQGFLGFFRFAAGMGFGDEEDEDEPAGGQEDSPPPPKVELSPEEEAKQKEQMKMHQEQMMRRRGMHPGMMPGDYPMGGMGHPGMGMGMRPGGPGGPMPHYDDYYGGHYPQYGGPDYRDIDNELDGAPNYDATYDPEDSDVNKPGLDIKKKKKEEMK